MIFINNHPLSNRRYNNRIGSRFSNARLNNHNYYDQRHQMSASNASVNVFPTIDSYAQLVEMRRQMIMKRREYIERQLKEMPLLYLALNCLFIFGLSVALITIQIVQINNKAQTSSAAGGIW